MQLPFFIIRSIADELDVKNELLYIKKIEKEKKVLQKIFSTRPGGQAVYSFGVSVIQRRVVAAKERIGEKVRRHIDDKTSEISSIMSQFEFLKYETLNGQRETMKKKISEESQQPIDKDMTRSFYIQNGYRYWPFEGEYWRDEIGNYQYLGGNRCE